MQAETPQNQSFALSARQNRPQIYKYCTTTAIAYSVRCWMSSNESLTVPSMHASHYIASHKTPDCPVGENYAQELTEKSSQLPGR